MTSTAPAPAHDTPHNIGRLGPDGTKRRWFVFRSPGDTISGRVVGYHPTRGARLREGGEPCGCIVVESDGAGEQLRVGLDKGSLAVAVYALHPRPGMRLAITFMKWDTSQRTGQRFKRFKAESLQSDAA